MRIKRTKIHVVVALGFGMMANLTTEAEIRAEPALRTRDDMSQIDIYRQVEQIDKLLYNKATGNYVLVSDQYKVSPKAAGYIKLSSEVADIYKNYAKKNIYRVIVLNERRQDRYIDVYSSSKRDVGLRISTLQKDNKALINKIVISDPKFVLQDSGFRVGMTLEDLSLLYRYLKIKWLDSYLVVANEQGINFILDTQDIPKTWFRAQTDLTSLPKKTKIKALYLVSN